MALRLGIVIVHYNTPADLARCLESLRAEADICPHEIVVVDNASTGPGLGELAARFPAVRWLRNAQNVGYGRGCNQGLAALPADFHLILNPDIVVLPGALASLLAFAEANPRAGLVGPQLLNEDGTIQESCRRFYTFKTLLLRRTLLGRLFPRSRTVARHLMRDFDHTTPRPVDWVLGGCLLVRREARQRCGPMDERFFLYFEDVDWCYRMWQCGFEVLYHPDARFVHRHRRASAQRKFSRSYWLHLGSLIAFYEKWSLVVYAVKKWRRPLTAGLYWLLDMGLLAAALLGAYGLRLLLQPLFPAELLPLSWYRVWFAYAAVMVTVTFVLVGRYRASSWRAAPAWGTHARQMGLVALLLLAGSYLGREEVVSRAVLLLLLGLYAGLSIWAATWISRLNRRLEAGFFALERTVLAGPVGDLAGWLAASCDLPREGIGLHRAGIDLVGYVTDDPAPTGGHPALGEGKLPWLGTLAALPQIVERLRVSQVAFWEDSGLAGEGSVLLRRLRALRIRLRWVLSEAWLLAAGARAEAFGTAGSGVLDPDDGGFWRRLALRPVEILVALSLLGAAAALAVPRHWRRRRGTIGQARVAGPGVPLELAGMAIDVRPDGRVLPLWWQPALLRALLTGRLALWGRRLGAGETAGSAPGELRPAWLGAAAGRPGLTGPWAIGDQAAAGTAPLAVLRSLVFDPGGWLPESRPEPLLGGRDSGQEVDRS